MKKLFIASVVAAADAALEIETADYVGQEWAPRVLMELDTPGVYNTSLVLI